MITSSNTFKIIALSTAAVLHVWLSNSFAPDVTVELESTTGATYAAVGSSFADLSKGVMTAQTVKTQAEPVDATNDLPDAPKPEPTAPAKPVETAATPRLKPASPPEIKSSATVASSTINPSRKPVETISVQAMLSSKSVSPPMPIPASKPAPTGAVRPALPTQTQSVTTTTRVTAIRPDQAAPTVSKRPERRKRRDPATDVKVAAKPAPLSKGNANRNARKGAASGQKTATAAVQGTKTGQAKTSGNAAASNYSGKVMRRLARIRKLRGVGRGKAEVAFKIAANGGLAGASLRRSSGSDSLDKAALRALHRAAPFPPPPAGAQRSFKILMTGS